MTLHAIPHRRVASPSLSPAARNNRPSAATLRPWPNLSAEAQIQIARILAGFMHRMLLARIPPEAEAPRVNRREQR
jgi:hypothetical protein